MIVLPPAWAPREFPGLRLPPARYSSVPWSRETEPARKPAVALQKAQRTAPDRRPAAGRAGCHHSGIAAATRKVTLAAALLFRLRDRLLRDFPAERMLLRQALLPDRCF